MLKNVQIKQYLQQIGYSQTVSLDLDTLFGLQWAHITHIPYENLDILAGIPLSLKAEDFSARFMDEPGIVQMRRHRVLVVQIGNGRFLTDCRCINGDYSEVHTSFKEKRNPNQYVKGNCGH